MCALELPGGQAAPLEERPRLVDEDPLDEAAGEGGAERSDGGPVTAGREAARVAVRERRRPRLEEGGCVIAHPAAALDLLPVDLPCARRRIGGAPHLVESPGEVDGSRARGEEGIYRLVEIFARGEGEGIPVG